MAKTLGFLANGALRLVGPKVAPVWAEIFKALFNRAWLLIPETEREQLEEYWRGRNAPAESRERWQGLREHQPCIALTTGTRLPLCTQAGHVLTFSVDVLEAMGGDFAVVAITHEMAHSILYGRGEKNHRAEPKTTEAYKAAERAVDDLLRSWGVEQTDLVQWSRKWDKNIILTGPVKFPDAL
jgi:hypothetical protein